MNATRYILLSLTVCAAMAATGTEDTLTFVKTDGSTAAFSTEGLTITYDDFAHAIITNSETSGETVDLLDVDYMCFGQVESVLPGDVNRDGEVNLADVNAVINVILSSDTVSAADVNGDGEVNLADVNAVIDIILAQ